jgi:glucan phosphoethanolaminetransferase (alkaline phosphatase superfamily)
MLNWIKTMLALLFPFAGFLWTQLFASPDLIGMLDAFSVGLFYLAILLLGGLLGKQLCLTVRVITTIAFFYFTAASFIHWQVFDRYLPVGLIQLWPEALRALRANYALFSIFLGSAVALLVAIAAWLYFKWTYINSRMASFCFGSAALALFLASQFYLDARGERFLNDVQESPIGQVLRDLELIPLVESRPYKIRDQGNRSLASLLAADSEAQLPAVMLAAIQNYYPESVDGRFPLYRAPNDKETIVTSQFSNVILVVLESVRSSEMGKYGKPHQSATPFLDWLSEHSINFEKNYSTAPLTVKSETAINCSLLDSFSALPLSKSSENLGKMTCLPSIFVDLGGTANWMHGYSSEFYSRKQYHREVLGFSELTEIENFYGSGFDYGRAKADLTELNQQDFLGWGVSDARVFDEALKQLPTYQRPFFLEILTLSNHLPFEFDWNIEFPDHLQTTETYLDRYRRGIYYTDQALAKFFAEFSVSEAAENTLLVVTGDHGIWVFDEDENINAVRKYEQFYRVPLMIYGKSLPPLVIDRASSHLDIAPTLLGLLGLSPAKAMLGNDLASTHETAYKRAPIVTVMDGKFGYHLDEVSCVPVGVCFRNSLQCEDASKQLLSASTLSCYKNTRDLLDLANSVELIGSPDDELSMIDEVINYVQVGHSLGFIPDTEKGPQ